MERARLTDGDASGFSSSKASTSASFTPARSITSRRRGYASNLKKQFNFITKKAAFASDVGVDNDPIETDGGGHIWHSVSGITPSRDRTLDEVKDVVEEHWREDEIASSLLSRRRWSLKYG